MTSEKPSSKRRVRPWQGSAASQDVVRTPLLELESAPHSNGVDEMIQHVLVFKHHVRTARFASRQTRTVSLDRLDQEPQLVVCAVPVRIHFAHFRMQCLELDRDPIFD